MARRRIGDVVAAAGLAVVLLCAGAGVRTRFACDFVKGVVWGHDVAVGIASGALAVRVDYGTDDREAGWTFDSDPPTPGAIYSLNPTLLGWMGFAWSRLSGAGLAGGTARVVTVPLWFVAALALGWPGIWWGRRRQARERRRRARDGLCLACGYDLRGSEGRCPECGSDRGGAAFSA